MASIADCVANGTYAGQKIAVKAKKVVWVKVGQGEVKDYSDFEVRIAGKISILGYNGDLNIHLQLNDQNPTTGSGLCFLQLNTHVDDQARYETKKGMLTVYAVLGGKEQNISILQCNNGEQTECKLFGHVNQTVHLEPTS
jgi:hypothetical protein